YRKSVVKTEQQKLLEKLLTDTGESFSRIADIACGGGSLTLHLRQKYPDALFTLADFNPEALKIARELNTGTNCTFKQENIYSLTFPDNSFDLVCCWQALSWLDEPEKALDELVRVVKPGGRIYASSLFNIHHEVDIYAKITDHTRKGFDRDHAATYNTYSAKLVGGWLEGKVQKFTFHEFIPSVDFFYDGRGLGTFTVKTEKDRLQVSGGYLMNWAILEILK
ncbi:MAG TPA: class I SAM-dependent methyltransferase, partial [Bacteroidia bacterium]|nr:class I SAM-dependent methyltransferase [Bacteroidia bacterium]